MINFNNLTGNIIDPNVVNPVKPSSLDKFTNFLTEYKGLIAIIAILAIVIILATILAVCIYRDRTKKTAVVNSDASVPATPLDSTATTPTPITPPTTTPVPTASASVPVPVPVPTTTTILPAATTTTTTSTTAAVSGAATTPPATTTMTVIITTTITPTASASAPASAPAQVADASALTADAFVELIRKESIIDVTKRATTVMKNFINTNILKDTNYRITAFGERNDGNGFTIDAQDQRSGGFFRANTRREDKDIVIKNLKTPGYSILNKDFNKYCDLFARILDTNNQFTKEEMLEIYNFCEKHKVSTNIDTTAAPTALAPSTSTSTQPS